MRVFLASMLVLVAACGPLEVDDACGGTCGIDALCIDALCVDAFPGRYILTLEVDLASTDPDGECWDEPFCGSPDPYVILSLDGREVGRTSEASETRSHRWSNEPFTVTLEANSELRLEAQDSDVDLDDFAARCDVRPVTISMLRSGRLSCGTTAGESRVDATIEPAP